MAPLDKPASATARNGFGMGQNQRIPISIQPGRALWPKGFCLLKPPSNLPPELPPVCLFGDPELAHQTGGSHEGNRGGGFCRPASPHEPCIKIKPSWRIRQSPNCLQVDRNGMTLEFTAMHTHTPATGSSTKEGSTSRGCSRMRISSRSECVPTSCAVTSVPLYLARQAPPGGSACVLRVLPPQPLCPLRLCRHSPS